jgi:opacity protein-like surface antigen
MHASIISALALALILVAGPSWGGDEPNPEFRVYMGAQGVGSWQFRVEDEFRNSVVETETDSGPAYGVAWTYGVRFREYLAVELDYEWIPGYDIEQTTVLGTTDDKIITHTLSSNISYYPLNGSIDPYVSVGAGWMHTELDDFGATGDGLALRFRVGADFWMTDNLGLRIEGQYTLPVTKEDKDLDLVGPRVGLFYRF